MIYYPQIFQYLLVIQPNDRVRMDMLKMKIKFEKEYGCTYAARLLPHITLAEFLLPEGLEYKVTTALYNYFFRKSPFKVSLNGYDGFTPHTVFAKVSSPSPIIHIVKGMKAKCQKLLSPIAEQKAFYSSNPHLTIARKMDAVQYTKAISDVKYETYHADFTVSSVTLLRREIDRFMQVKSSYTTVAKFEFSGNDTFPGEQLTLNF